MAKKDKKQKKQYGMGPGQSMAMAGNTGLATASEKQANTISKGLQNLGKDSSFTSIGQNIGEIGSRTRRPANVENYARKMDTINKGFEKGATTFVGPDGIERINFLGTGLKDDQGRTILSMMNPELKSTKPTRSQFFGRDGDVSRAFKGYNAIKYDEPGQAYSPVSMRYNRGIYEQGGGLPGLLSNIISPGSGFVMQALRDLATGYKPDDGSANITPDDGSADKGKPLFSGNIENFMEATYPTMREPSGDGILGAYDKFTNLAKAMVGAENYKTITDETVKSYDDLVNQTDSSYKETSDEFNKTVEDMSDVEKEIFLNPKLKFARNDSAIRLALEQENDAKELKKTRDKIKAEGESIKQQFNNRLKEIMESTYPTMREPRGDGILGAYDRLANLTKGMLGAENYKTTTEETLDTPNTPEIFRDQFTGTGQSYMDTEDNFNSRIPIGTANAPGGFTGLPGRDFASNAPGGIGLVNSQAYRDMLLDNYRIKEMGTGNMPGGVDPMGLPVQGDVTIDVNKDLISPFINETPIGELDTNLGIKSLNEFDVRSLGGNNEEPRDNNNAFGDEASNSITDYFNPGNLVDVGQAGTTGETYGENKFAIFNTVDDGLIALTKDLNKKVGDFDGDVEKIISKYASGDPNANNYINFIKGKVGSTVEEDEIPTLVESVIAMENKPEIADQYLAYLQKNADKIYDGIISS